MRGGARRRRGHGGDRVAHEARDAAGEDRRVGDEAAVQARVGDVVGEQHDAARGQLAGEVTERTRACG